jgi:glycosyltransferase involved in cell wall biosynthesis
VQKVAVITCYKDPDYVRATVLRSAVKNLPDTKLITVKNRFRSPLRYPEVLLRLIWLRLVRRPDVYLVTFRGYEVLPLVTAIAVGKRVIFDEFINPLEWAVYEHRKLRDQGIIAKLIKSFYRFCLDRTEIILADTQSHANYSSQLMGIPVERYAVIPVSTDESVFQPQGYQPTPPSFTVFYYGSMLPLHGLNYVIEAALLLKNTPEIDFFLIGGGAQTEAEINAARQKGAHIMYKSRVPFKELATLAAEASLCLGGPFGNTLQSSMVVTGKTFQFLCAGLPVLVGETQEHELFRDQENCLIVPQGNAQALAEKIRWAYENKDKLESIGQAGRQVYVKHYSNSTVAEKLAVLFKAGS